MMVARRHALVQLPGPAAAARRTSPGTARATTYATLTAAMGVGSICGALAAGARGRVSPAAARRSARWPSALAELLAAVAPTLRAADARARAARRGVGHVRGRRQLVLQLAVEPAMRGRVMALYCVVFLGSTPIGAPLVGWLAQAAGPRAGLLAGAVAALVAAGAALVAFTPAEQRRRAPRPRPFFRSSARASGPFSRSSSPMPRSTAALGELDLAVVDDLDLVAPRVAEAQPARGQVGDPLRGEGGSHRVAVVDDEAEVAVVVRAAGARRREREELVAASTNAIGSRAPAQLEAEQAPVEVQRRVDVADLEGDVVDAHQPCHACEANGVDLAERLADAGFVAAEEEADELLARAGDDASCSTRCSRGGSRASRSRGSPAA